jgi:hypothetical protein
VTPTELPAVANRPGLPAIGYRLGTYASFRAAVLHEASRTPALRRWTTREQTDYGTALLEQWAYVADILAFYQERIANEAFLRTAVRPESVQWLAEGLGYRPAPALSAIANLAFTTDRELELPEGTRVQHVPQHREPPQTFETDEPLAAGAELSEMRLRALEGVVLEAGDREVAVRGTGLTIAPGDQVVLVSAQGIEAGKENWDVRVLVELEEDPELGITWLRWERGLGARWRNVDPAGPPQQLGVFRRRGWMFGYNAPGWVVDRDGKPVQRDPGQLPHDPQRPAEIYLDDLYPEVVPDSRVALVTERLPDDAQSRAERYVELYRVLEVAQTVHEQYGVVGRVTRLTVDIPKRKTTPENIELFSVRGTYALLAPETLEMVKLAAGPLRRLVLDGTHERLERDRRLVVVGEQGAEAARVAEADVETVPGATVVDLQADLTGTYRPPAVRVLGNVAPASHGETVRDEVLGSGDAASAFQAFTLAKSPLAHLPAPGGAPGGASTLEVWVDGVRWQEVRDFHGRGGAERVYVTRTGPDGKTEVRFGDGITGAGLPSGRNNVVAVYRVGGGVAGRVPAATLRTPLDRPPGLRAVVNPLPSEGGADAESAADVRRNLPKTVRTFGRIVSLRDFEDAALETRLAAKARAVGGWDGESHAVFLTVAGDGGIPLGAETLANLVADLDARRDPNRRLRVIPHRPLPIRVEATVTPEGDRVPEDVAAAAHAAIVELLSFERQEFGAALRLSEVYRALQDADGVAGAVVTLLAPKRPADEDRVRAFERRRRARRGEDVPAPGVLPVVPVPADEIAALEAPEDAVVRPG